MPEHYRPREADLAGRLTPRRAEANGRRRHLKSISVDVPRRDREAELRERALEHLRERGVREFRGDPVAALGDRWRKDNS